MKPGLDLLSFPRYERPVTERPPPYEIYSAVVAVEQAVLNALDQGQNVKLSWTSSNGRRNELSLVDIFRDPDYLSALRLALSSVEPNIDLVIATFWDRFLRNRP